MRTLAVATLLLTFTGCATATRSSMIPGCDLVTRAAACTTPECYADVQLAADRLLTDQLTAITGVNAAASATRSAAHKRSGCCTSTPTKLKCPATAARSVRSAVTATTSRVRPLHRGPACPSSGSRNAPANAPAEAAASAASPSAACLSSCSWLSS